MLHALRKLARDIHRRSVWQVLAAYLLLGYCVFELVDLLTAILGLPLWTPSMAFALLGIGLPIVLATAIVQRGLPGLRMVDVVDPNELEGRSPEAVHVIPEEHPLYGAGVLTWRNAVLAGVMASALLVTSVVAYLAMWAFGIGPVGSLSAQGILEPQDTVAVADFANRTEDPTLGRRVRTLLEAELARSTLVNVLDWSTRDTPAQLPSGSENRSPDGPPLGPVGRAKVIIDGEVTTVDEGYRVYARVVLPDGTMLAGFGRTASSADDLPAQVGRISVRLRERFGESVRQILDDTGRASRN